MKLFEPDQLTVGKATTALLDEIKSQGVMDIRLSSEVAELEVAARQAEKMNAVGEHFCRSLNTLPPEQVLWIGLYDKDDKCIATCGARLDGAHEWSLQHHIQQYFERTFRAEDGDFVQVSKSSCAYVSSFSGQTVYVGEGHVNDSWRNKNLLGLAQRLLIISAFVRWSPKLIYGFMRPDKIFNNYHLNWGYSVAKPQALIWVKPPAEKSLHDLYFVGLGAEGVLRLSQDPLLVGLNRRLESNKKEKSLHEAFETEQLGADSKEDQHRVVHNAG